jgi:hypothetical protein
MKLASIALTIIITQTAFSAGACPNLTGSFLCKQGNLDSKTLMVSQSESFGITTYSVITTHGDTASYTKLITDNIESPYTEIDKDLTYQGSIRSECNNTKLINYDSGMVKNASNEIIQSYNYVESVYLDTTRNLVIVNKGLVTEHGDVKEVNNSVTCVRKQ